MLDRIQTAIDQHKQWAEDQAKVAAAAEERSNRLKALDSLRTDAAKRLAVIDAEIDAKCEETNQLVEAHAASQIRLAG